MSIEGGSSTAAVGEVEGCGVREYKGVQVLLESGAKGAREDFWRDLRGGQ